ncbi:MAG: tRNA pseudouridine(55) synthase TruB [Dehalococcoidia bacterium]|jgi:tRNA pseudouridine55 synthase|nr:tRNA pseudouridine(55) synthase TruB [Dehalococcoidia bacterium]
MDSILLIDKPKGMTSAKVVALVKKKVRSKVGHTGTLDPLATGLLIILTGSRTKQASQFLHMDKTYTVRALFGMTTTTYDVAGEVVKTCDRVVSREEVEAALPGFLGEIQQVPPAYSAKKLGGKKAYELARKGLDVEIPASAVTVYSLRLVSFEYPAFSLECNVSSGFYVRSLVHDLGERLGVGATVEEVRRLRVGAFTIEQAMSLDAFLDAAAAPAAESRKAGE